MKDFKFLLKHNFIVNLGPFFFFFLPGGQFNLDSQNYLAV